MTAQNPATIEERLNRALQELGQLQAVVSELATNSKQQEELLTELTRMWAGYAGDYFHSQMGKAKEGGQTTRQFSEEGEQKQQIYRELTEIYKHIEEVKGFSIGEYLEEIRVYALLQMDSYDGMLMERLTTAEAELEDNFPRLSLIIRHIPVGEIDLETYLSDKGSLVWQRD